MGNEAKSVESVMKEGMRRLLIREGKRGRKKMPLKRKKNVSQHFFFLGKRKLVLKEKGGMKKRWREEEIWKRHVPCKKAF